MARSPASQLNYVAVIADNPQTLADLDAYFKQVGVPSSGGRRLQGEGAVPPAATALVLFPDDYAARDVDEVVLGLRRTRPRLFIVLVTSAPQSLTAATQPLGRAVSPLILPKPAFGWTILDAIRSADSRSKPGKS